MDNTEFTKRLEDLNDAKQARVRLGIAWLLHGFTIPPIVSIMYSVKTNYWMPTIAGTAAAFVAFSEGHCCLFCVSVLQGCCYWCDLLLP